MLGEGWSGRLGLVDVVNLDGAHDGLSNGTSCYSILVVAQDNISDSQGIPQICN